MPTTLVAGAALPVGLRVLRGLSALGQPCKALLPKSATPATIKQLVGEMTAAHDSPEGADGASQGASISGGEGQVVLSSEDSSSELAHAAEGCDRMLILTKEDVRQEEWEKKLTDAAVEAGVKHVVKVSLVNRMVAKNSPIAKGKQHFMIEEYVKEKAPSWTVLRPNYLMHDLLKGRMHQMVCARTISLPVKHSKVAMVHADDVAHVAVMALLKPDKHSGKTHVLTGPDAMRWDQVAWCLSKGIGDEVRYSPIPLYTLQPSLWIKGVDPDEIQYQVQMAKFHISGGMEEVTNTVEEITGRKAKTLLEFAEEHRKSWPKAKSAGDD